MNPWHRGALSLQTGVTVAVAGLVLFLSLNRIDRYPSPDALPGYIDDAQHLLAAQRLAFSGLYDFGPALGPTVVLPVAAALKVFGGSLVAGRLVMVAFLLATFALFWCLVAALGNRKVAVAATLVYALAPGVMAIYQGRRVMGEVPATMFMLAGLLVWFGVLGGGDSRGRRWRLLLCGFLLGLAAITKNQFLMLVPAWAAVWALNWLYYHQAKHSDFVLPMASAAATVLAWLAAQFLLLPNSSDLASASLSQWTGASSRGLMTFSRAQMVVAINFLTSDESLYRLALPSLVYAGLRGLRRSDDGLRWAMLLILAAGWLGWYMFLSVGWYRYAFTGLTLCAIFVAFFFHDATGGFSFSLRRLADLRGGQWDMALAGRTVLIALFVMLMARSTAGRVSEALASTCDSHVQMADYVARNVPAEAVIETYSPEICLLSGHLCHVPAGPAQDAVIRYVWYGGERPSASYPVTAPYLLVGYAGLYSGLYDPNAIARDYRLEVSLGANAECKYDLYSALSRN